MYFADGFMMFVIKLVSWIKSDPNSKLYFKILVGSLVYGFIVHRFFSVFLKHRTEILALETKLAVEQERTKQLEIAAKK